MGFRLQTGTVKVCAYHVEMKSLHIRYCVISNPGLNADAIKRIGIYVYIFCFFSTQKKLVEAFVRL